MATVTDWIQHLTTDVDTATEGIQVAGQVYPMVGSEMWWVLAGIVFWLAWTFSTAAGEDEEQEKLARKKHGANDYKKNIAEW
ncbi:uncharacterized protein METZ01_LOCUS151910 [marine metagenome]|uniref:Uncharacterized protein n=1 Tax=marine metagenome TaxID=408172 RepID=A0A382ABY7_9ZZZZ